MAALRNALRVVGKELERVRVVMSGAGAAGTAILKLLLQAGATDVVVADVRGRAPRPGRLPRGSTRPCLVAGHTNPAGVTGTLTDAMRGADVFVGVSAPNIITDACMSIACSPSRGRAPW